MTLFYRVEVTMGKIWAPVDARGAASSGKNGKILAGWGSRLAHRNAGEDLYQAELLWCSQKMSTLIQRRHGGESSIRTSFDCLLKQEERVRETLAQAFCIISLPSLCLTFQCTFLTIVIYMEKRIRRVLTVPQSWLFIPLTLQVIVSSSSWFVHCSCPVCLENC